MMKLALPVLGRWPLLLALAAAPASAATMGTIPQEPAYATGTLPVALACGTTLTWQVNLAAGKDYAFISFFDRQGTATLRAPDGAAVMSFPVIPSSGTDMQTGHEAHATVTGAYFLDVVVGPSGCTGSDDGYFLSYQDDCLGGRRTRCILPVGVTRRGEITFPSEWDWWRVTLRAGRRYDVTIDTSQRDLVLRDRMGRQLARADWQYDGPPAALRGFRAPVSGTYFVDIEGVTVDPLETGLSLGGYSVTLTAR